MMAGCQPLSAICKLQRWQQLNKVSRAPEPLLVSHMRTDNVLDADE